MPNGPDWHCKSPTSPPTTEMGRRARRRQNLLTQRVPIPHAELARMDHTRLASFYHHHRRVPVLFLAQERPGLPIRSLGLIRLAKTHSLIETTSIRPCLPCPAAL